MAKRTTGVGRSNASSSRKTTKRLAAKKAMLIDKAAKKMRHTRKIRISA